MKKLLLAATSCMLLFACNNKADQPIAEQDTLLQATTYSWKPTLNDSSGRLEMIKDTVVGPQDFEPDAVIVFLNQANPDVQLVFDKTSNDTIYLRIPDATYLTQQMGSSGATMYLASVVYNLTEIPGLHFVHFDFTEGDHASPGTFRRDNFKDE